MTMARARPARFFMPPDSSLGSLSSEPSSPTMARHSQARVRICAGVMSVCSSSISPMFLQMVMESNSAAPWNRKPNLFRNSIRSRRRMEVTSSPSIQIMPSSGSSSLTMFFSSTDLPWPLRPMITRVSPLWISRSVWSSTTFGTEGLGDALDDDAPELGRVVDPQVRQRGHHVVLGHRHVSSGTRSGRG